MFEAAASGSPLRDRLRACPQPSGRASGGHRQRLLSTGEAVEAFGCRGQGFHTFSRLSNLLQLPLSFIRSLLGGQNARLRRPSSARSLLWLDCAGQGCRCHEGRRSTRQSDKIRPEFVQRVNRNGACRSCKAVIAAKAINSRKATPNRSLRTKPVGPGKSSFRSVETCADEMASVSFI